MELELQLVKKYDMKTQHLIFGFVHESQILLPSDNAFWIITDLIIYTIMAFTLALDSFSQFHAKDWDLTNSGRGIIKKYDHRWRTCYGRITISNDSKQIHEWIIKIRSVKGQNAAIGIEEATYGSKNTCFHNEISVKSYAITGWSGKKWDPLGHSHAYDQGKFGTGDTICMILNMTKKTISFAVNDKSPTKAFDVESSDIGYCLAVSVCSNNDYVEILSYKVNQYEEEKKMKGF